MAPKGKRGPIPEAREEARNETNPPAAVEESRPPEERERPAFKRMAIPIDEKGKIAWENMRASTREETRKFVTSMITDRELAASMGIDKPLIEIFPVEWVGALYDSLGQIEAALAPKILGVAPQVAQAVFVYSEAEKTKLAKPTAAVINKYAADWLIRFKEEIALLMLLGSMTYAKIMAAKMAQAVLVLQSVQPPASPIKTNGAEKQESKVA